ncbi:hypothetical protein [Bradyrhizobium canariense]|uniref:hypothetical protein n=1 Tax=Bradyrhizobium canariense TaxID=255045 RepID=UPI0011780F8D|nr:hypothetical protein [Bradyrhizobium canariense]
MSFEAPEREIIIDGRDFLWPAPIACMNALEFLEVGLPCRDACPSTWCRSWHLHHVTADAIHGRSIWI